MAKNRLFRRNTCVSMRALATASLLLNGTAWAQDATAPAQPSADAVQPTADDAKIQSEAQAQAGDQFDPTKAEDVGLIVVTAQKREEKLQSVPVTVNVVGAKQLDQQKITNIGELTRAVPALSGTFIGGGVPQIRGVATTGFSQSAESAVSVVLDGVVTGKAGVADLFDVERVEVLSGPQGMLFGKNASSGVINIITVAPKYNKLEVSGSIDYGRFEYEREQITVNVPIAGNAAFRATGYHNRDESVVRNALSGDKGDSSTWGGRARFRWEPTDNLELNLIGDYAKSDLTNQTGLVFGLIPDPAGVNAPLVAKLAECGIDELGPDLRESCANAVNEDLNDVKRYGVSAQIDWTLPGEYLLSSITAKRWLDNQHFDDYRPCCDVDATQDPIFDIGPAASKARVFSQEFRLTSPSEQPIEFVAGLYYQDTDTHYEVLQAGTLGFFINQSTLLPPFPNWAVLSLITGLPVGPQAPDQYLARGQQITVDNKSYAAFGQATIHATDKLSFILGARYTHEALDVDGPVFSAEKVAAILAAQGIGYYPFSPLVFSFSSVDENTKEDNFSWRVGAQYEPSSDLMFYATAARGYKGPAVDDQGGSANPVIRPEIPMSYELGSKATLLNGRLFAAATLFYTKVDDFQTTVFVPDKVPAGFASGNAPYMKTRGIDVSIFGRPFDGLTMSAGAIYNIAKYSPDYRVACFTGPTATEPCETVNGASVAKPNPQIPNVPKFKFVANAEYDHDLSASLQAFVQSDVQYQTKVFTSSTPDSIQRLSDQFFLNGSIGLRSPDGRWSASVWGRNLLGKSYRTYLPDFLATFAAGHEGAYITSPNSGLFTTYGVSLAGRF